MDCSCEDKEEGGEMFLVPRKLWWLASLLNKGVCPHSDLELGSPNVDPVSHHPHNRILLKEQPPTGYSLAPHNVQNVMGLFMRIKGLGRRPLEIKLNGIRIGEINKKPRRRQIFAKEREKVCIWTI